MAVGKENCINLADIFAQGLFTKIGAYIYKYVLSISL